jgi:hypothetical protein
MSEELILISASQRNLVLWPYNIPLIKVYANMYERVDWRKMLIGNRFLLNAVKDIYFTSKMNFEKLGT